MLTAAPVLGAPKVLRVCDDVVQPVSLDPVREFSEKYYTIIQQIFDSLVRFGPDGKLEPALATSWKWTDPNTVEFKLREGVTFHDGEPFDADAVKFSIERFIDPKEAFPGAGFLGSIAGVEVVDARTVRVKTKSPDGILIHRLAGLLPILPPKYTRQDGRHPVGTGAFEFERWDDGDRIVLKANKKWWGGPLKTDELDFVFLPSDKQADALLSGKVDVVTELPGTDTLRVMKSGVAKIVKKETLYTVGASVNVSAGPMADKRVRQAINYAINKEDLVRYDLLGNGKPLGSYAMHGEIGADDEAPYPYDPGRAKALLREAGYGSGLSLKAVVKVQGERAMKIIAKNLEKVGIKVKTTPTTDATVIADIQKGGWDFTLGGCPDPLAHSYFIQFIFLSSFSPYSIHKDPAYDALVDKMVATLDPKAQDAAGRELDRKIHDDALGVFTYQRVKTYGVRNGVTFVPYVTGMPYFFMSGPK